MTKLEEQYKHLKYVIHDVFLKNVPVKTTRQGGRIFVFGIPQYLNYGDLAIACAEDRFLRKNFPNKEIINIPEPSTNVQLRYLSKRICKDDIITIPGGGNMGEEYSFQDQMRIKILGAFPHNRIVSFPQSTSYNIKNPSSHFFMLKDTLSDTTDTYLFARDKFSFQFMKNNFPSNVHVFLTPDIVLNLTFNKALKRSAITTFLRRDSEKLQNSRVKDLIDELSKQYEVQANDTEEPYWKHIVTDDNRETFVNNKLAEFASSKLVITDRLHGMIFSIITGTPAIVFDNANHKIKHAYEDWFFKVPYIYYADTNLDLYKIAKEIMNDHVIQTKVPDFIDKYDPLIRALTTE